MTRTAAVVVLAMALVSGCASDDEPKTVKDKKVVPPVSQESESPSPSAQESTAAAADARDYFEAIAERDVDGIREAAKSAAPDSPAYVYATHQANVIEADLDGGQSRDAADLVVAGGEYQMCESGNCITFADVEQNESGQVVSFSIDGKPVDGLLSQGNGKAVTAGGAKFTFLTAYTSVQSKALFVALKVQTGNNDININVFTAKYRDPSGKTREATSAGGPIELEADSNALVYSAFLGVKPGGVMTLDGCVSDCNSTYEVKIKTR